MNKTEIENHILRHYYESMEGGISSPINILVDKIPSANKSVFENVMERMEKDFLLEDLRPGYFADITGSGINEAEKRGLIDSEKVELNYKVRLQILDFAAKTEDDLESDGWAEIDDIEIDVEGDHSSVDFNYLFLHQLGLIRGESGRYYQITDVGKRNLKKWKESFRFDTEYKRILELTPQARGIQFEKLIVDIIAHAGWEAEHNVQTSNEQMDVIINKGRDYYLIECKWEKNPIEAAVSRELFGKLFTRTQTNGILFSMSGFTAGVEKNVQQVTNNSAILLFGEKDILKLISNPSSFEDLLNAKYKALISQQKVIYE